MKVMNVRIAFLMCKFPFVLQFEDCRFIPRCCRPTGLQLHTIVMGEKSTSRPDVEVSDYSDRAMLASNGYEIFSRR